MNLELEEQLRAAASRLNRSDSVFAGPWNLYTPEDITRALWLAEDLRAEKLAALEDMDAVITALRSTLRMGLGAAAKAD